MGSGEIGNLALIGGVVAAAVGTVASVSGWVTGRPRLVVAGGRGLLVTVALAGVAIGALAWALLTGDFSLTYVADTTTRATSWPFRLAGLWGGQAGSLLLWGFVLLCAGALATRVHSARTPLVAAVSAAVGGWVLATALLVADPFNRLSVPAIDGGGLVPILEHPAMLYHPVLLYAGHAGLLAPLALAVGGLASGRLDHAWLATTRRAVLAAWVLLTVGLFAGAHWSYAEVGWGGFWSWDPVENSGLLPWLACLAFLHAAARAERTGTACRGTLRRSDAWLAGLPFCLSLFGAALTRSGAAQSVHAFAQDSAVGVSLTVLFGAVVAALLAAGLRHSFPAPAPSVRRWSRDGALSAAVGLLLLLGGVVALGMVYPLAVRALTGDRILLTGRYFAVFAAPIAILAVIGQGVGPSLAWAGRSSALAGVVSEQAKRLARPGLARARARVRLRWAAAALAGAVLALSAIGPRRVAPLALLAAAGFGTCLILAELWRTRRLRRAAGLLAHLGVALALVGVAASMLGHDTVGWVGPGQTLTVGGGYTLRHDGLIVDQGARFRRVRVILTVTVDGSRVGQLRPSRKVYPDQAVAVAEVARRSRVEGDLLVGVRQIDASTQAALLQVHERPWISLLWWGGLLAAAGGVLSLTESLRPRRLRSQIRSDALPASGRAAGREWGTPPASA